jgi:hypothetical protein
MFLKLNKSLFSLWNKGRQNQDWSVLCHDTEKIIKPGV